MIQEFAEFACVSDLRDESHDHFSLQIPQYVQFTSPIRRFMDIVVHRFVKAAIDGDPEEPYTCDEIRYICARVNSVNKLSKKYGKAMKMLKVANKLRTPMYLPCFVKSFDNFGIEFTTPYLGQLKSRQSSLKYSDLSIGNSPIIKPLSIDLLCEKQFNEENDDYRAVLNSYVHLRKGCELDSDVFSTSIGTEHRAWIQNYTDNGSIDALKRSTCCMPIPKQFYVDITFERRLYDTVKNHPAARKRLQLKKDCVINLVSDAHSASIDHDNWQYLQKCLTYEDEKQLRQCISHIQEDVRNQNQTGKMEVTSEMYDGALMVKHHVRFVKTLKKGTVVPIQWGAECTRGYLQPVIRMLNLTHEKDICIEHRNDPIKCFAETATDKILAEYQTVEHYKRIWLPILAMEAASKTVSAGESVLCNNVPITFKERNKQYYGTLKLDLQFCKRRSIKIFTNSKDGEDEANDYMCIRYHTGQNKIYESSTESCTSFIRNVWVGHAVALYVSVSESEHVCLEFKIQHYNVKPPVEMINKGETKCTVEFLTKGLPDR